MDKGTIHQADWLYIFEESAYASYASAGRACELNSMTFKKYINCDVIPREKNEKRKENKKTPVIRLHDRGPIQGIKQFTSWG